MMRIVCLPIDSRPCCTQFIKSLVSWAGSEVIFPRKEEMDDFKRRAAYDDNRAFLERELPGCDAAVISLDHWCYGSLLASREEAVSEGEALNRVQDLRMILKRHSNIPVFMSSVILRSSISSLSVSDLEAYHAMTEYSVASDRFSRFGLQEDAEKMEEAKRHIPDEVLQKVLRVRKRNLLVNLAAMELVAEGVVKSLSVLQEDSQVYGLPKKDQAEIQKKIEELKAENVFLRNGTDEAGALSAGEAMWRSQKPLPVDIVYLGRKDFTALYEDRPFQENMESACREIGIQAVPGSETVIFVCCPPNGEQQEAFQLSDDESFREYADQIQEAAQAGKRVYVLDLIGANGGSAALIRSLNCADELWGYSGWNTASNSMGTLLSQVITDHIRGERNLPYYQERLLDDYIYQTHLRGKLNKVLSALGEDVYSLRDRERAEQTMRDIFSQELPNLWPLRQLPAYHLSLPWMRTFEVKVEVL
mgnify:CR=1 FL=1